MEEEALEQVTLVQCPILRRRLTQGSRVLGSKTCMLMTVSVQFLRLQISTFDKSSIPTLAHSRMEIVSLSFPLYFYPPPLRPTIKTNKDKNTKTSF